MPSTKVKLAIGGTMLAGIAYYLYASNQTASAAANQAASDAAAKLAAAKLAASNAVLDPNASKAVSTALSTVGPQKAINPIAAATSSLTTPAGILGGLPGMMLHYWPDTDVLALSGLAEEVAAPKPGEGYVSALDLFYEVSMAGKNIIFQQVTGPVPSVMVAGASPVAPVYTYFRLMEPNDALPNDWSLFLGPNAADATYRAAGINVVAMRTVPVPASSMSARPSFVDGGPPQPLQPISLPLQPISPLLQPISPQQPIERLFTPATATTTPPADRQADILAGLKDLYVKAINGAPGIDSFSLTQNGPADWPALDLVYYKSMQGFQIFLDLVGDPSTDGSQIIYTASAGMSAPTPTSLLMFAPGEAAAAAIAAGLSPKPLMFRGV